MKFKAIKRIFCGILSAVMSLTLLPQIPVSAKTGSTTYTFDGYKVEYSVMNEWDKNQNIGITITNTGTDTIENWAIKYDASGEISNLWNGKINKKDGTSYIIENAGYNSDIKPNQTVNFGYQLTSENPAVPSSYSFCMKRVPKTEGYTVDHYFVDKELSMPMTLNLYNYNGEKDIDCIYNYSPTSPQWWITGFNPEYVGKVDVTKHVMIGTVDFTGHEEMYDELIEEMNKPQNAIKRESLIFDEVNHTVWIIWYERNLV